MPNIILPDGTEKIMELGVDYVMLDETDARNIRRVYNVSYGLRFKLTDLGEEYYTCELPLSQKFYCNNSLTIFNENAFSGRVYPYINYPQTAQDCLSTSPGCFGKNYIPLIDQGKSMYKQLEYYINQTLDTCLDFSVFRGFNITKNGTLNIKVNTTNQTVIAVLKYPLIITDPTTKKQTKLEYFYYDTKIRLKLLHEIVRKMVDNDKTNEQFDVRTSGLLDTSHMNLQILKHDNIKTIIQNDWDNVVRIEDNFSSPTFMFQFARMNRPPVLANLISPRLIRKDDVLNESNLSDGIDYDPDDESIQRFYSSDKFELQLLMPHNLPVSTFSIDNVDELCDAVLGINNFTIRVCVSDSHNQYANPCSTYYTPFDVSSDWQDITFVITNCP
jgi:hypothetical protein